MGVIMQAFYWDCPKLEGREYAWWSYVTGKVALLRQAGFSALWLPAPDEASFLPGRLCRRAQ